LHVAEQHFLQDAITALNPARARASVKEEEEMIKVWGVHAVSSSVLHSILSSSCTPSILPRIDLGHVLFV
jgi:hypothetical protein